ncbi:MAG: hypothetical protein ACYTHJ_17540 [Planctomycetota bacterium]|jgi:hypothetical protein
MDGQDARSSNAAESLLGNLHHALMDVDETERYRLLSSLLAGLAERSGHSNGRAGATAEQVEELNERIRKLDHERASAVDDLKIIKAELEKSQGRVEDEVNLATQLKASVEEQRHRLDKLQQENEDLKAEVVAKNNALHRAEVEMENTTLRAQRAEHASTDRSVQEKIEQEKNQLIHDLETVRAEMDQLRADKDQQIDKLEESLRSSKSAASEGGDTLLNTLWEPLAKCSPALVEGHVPPTTQSAERLFGGFVELAMFVNKFDQGIRPFLTRYTRHHPTVKVPWEAYAKGDDLLTVMQRTVAPVGGRPVGVLKMRLRLLNQWTDAAMIGCDSAIESIASEMDTFLRGDMGFGENPNKTVKEFLRDDGHELFMQHMREIRSSRLGDAFGRGG